ncbi:uncharacterized protein MYCFIDRAFT_209512 [Pseudocercospora fijiensis CIRAD86]|uniref:Uncharacterized protein n=1 Tax=Pseudocercospora fijiensis (strain CIRAD86) TaxID=383855 RepID=N1Q983_PSEFD|nr:uncharacterized protein MYCFIDRAFT_209512 [Pseudocercospora fijiensis CIRAD86]EME87457.1 hypothetical protein MYCFIDRAFT_209512 [Pseudocercospora fijiensis CIRAD86]
MELFDRVSTAAATIARAQTPSLFLRSRQNDLMEATGRGKAVVTLATTDHPRKPKILMLWTLDFPCMDLKGPPVLR